MTFHVPEKYRVQDGQMASNSRFGNNGAFVLKLSTAQVVYAIASDQFGWEHVSVSRRDRCPTWFEMCQVKDMFWDADDCVVQYHPPESEYVNNHPYCLHLWRKIDEPFPLPPRIMVGFK
jgi:hypothetical protein